MTGVSVWWVMAVVVMLGVVGVAGPVFLRRAAPALARAPRVAITLLVGGILIWPTAVLSLGLVLAWVVSGPVILPAGASQVCQQCLAAASPFAVGPVGTWIPAAVLVIVPVVVGVLGALGIAVDYRARVTRSGRMAAVVLEGSTRRRICGQEVAVVADARPWALAFPARQGGIALSTAALDRLHDDEVAAVIEHEATHLRQRHHLLLDLVASINTYLHRVPFIRESAAALPSYLELAADERACRRAGTPALVRALLVLGERTVPAGGATGSLFAAGPDRIPHLVNPATGRRGYLAAVVTSAHLIVLGLVTATVLTSYATALLTGCA
ncbi:hypothetical protein HMPREF0290_0487 [Corynebacterium efficiens YS-314]|uniref:Peptidase M48 domain-containing protein n=1 Tax=Corynebacterium efficiens (strain DSM 44549 / YS-314 / AJ 12310 / JCM 11189 / NBRC 100395) TaxID=196164 RepID=Q8FSR6_COREF|nr:M56 family metallopeptidase [Corynebacterium efficiens]EEW50907.1 hypothetical protein HMPREF0290_0487 [Corynebacterium efficiens YS-314]BAC17126.1 hypothetical protein [Corynebacterium efficiens YS-314]